MLGNIRETQVTRRSVINLRPCFRAFTDPSWNVDCRNVNRKLYVQNVLAETEGKRRLTCVSLLF